MKSSLQSTSSADASSLTVLLSTRQGRCYSPLLSQGIFFFFFFGHLVLEESVKVTFPCRMEALHNKVNLKLVFEARSRLGSKTCEISMSMWDAKVQRDLRVKSGGAYWSRPDQRNQAGEWGEREHKGWGQILLPGELPHLKHAEATGATEKMCE